MSVSAFGRFLLERGALSREALIDALEYQRGCNRSVADLAVERGLLTGDALQSAAGIRRRTGRRFEDIAVTERLLTREQLSGLILAQMRSWVFLSDCLVRRGHLPRRELERWLLRWHGETSGEAAAGARVPAGLPNGDALSHALDVLPGLLRETAHLEPAFTAVEAGPPQPGQYDILVTQRVLGDRDMTFALALPEAVAARCASADEGRGHALDAIAELLNILVGNVCARLATSADRLTADPVLTFAGSESCAWARTVFSAVFETGPGRVYLACSFDE